VPNEKLQRVRDGIDAMNRGEYEEGVAVLHEDVEWFTTPEWMGERVYRGRAAVIGLWETIAETFDEYRWDLEDAVEEGEHVVCAVRWRGTGKASHVEVDRMVYLHWEFRDGMVIRARPFSAMGEALRDAGLRA
jgi:ketosteroid isomerase-like protein